MKKYEIWTGIYEQIMNDTTNTFSAEEQEILNEIDDIVYVKWTGRKLDEEIK